MGLALLQPRRGWGSGKGKTSKRHFWSRMKQQQKMGLQLRADGSARNQTHWMTILYFFFFYIKEVLQPQKNEQKWLWGNQNTEIKKKRKLLNMFSDDFKAPCSPQVLDADQRSEAHRDCMRKICQNKENATKPALGKRPVCRDQQADSGNDISKITEWISPMVHGPLRPKKKKAINSSGNGFPENKRNPTNLLSYFYKVTRLNKLGESWQTVNLTQRLSS